MRVLLLGDSHLAYLYRDHHDLVTSAWGDDVTCRAFGGAVLADLPGQVRGIDLAAFDTVVVSVGSNDIFVGDTPERFAAGLDAFVAEHPGATWTWLESPNFEHPAAGLSPAIRTRELLAPLGSRAFVGDGVHLSREGYEVLVAALSEAAQ